MTLWHQEDHSFKKLKTIQQNCNKKTTYDTRWNKGKMAKVNNDKDGTNERSQMKCSKIADVANSLLPTPMNIPTSHYNTMQGFI